MKHTNSIISIAACVAVITLVGCSKSNPSAGAGSTSTTTSATDAAKDMAGKAADTAKDVAGQAVAIGSNAVASVTNAVSAVIGPVAEGIANAQKFIADKNYQGALDELNKLSGLQLSDDQQKMVSDLKDQATKLLSGGTAGAVDAAKGLLGK